MIGLVLAGGGAVTLAIALDALRDAARQRQPTAIVPRTPQPRWTYELWPKYEPPPPDPRELFLAAIRAHDQALRGQVAGGNYELAELRREVRGFSGKTYVE